jgi:hypothetical protein
MALKPGHDTEVCLPNAAVVGCSTNLYYQSVIETAIDFHAPAGWQP